MRVDVRNTAPRVKATLWKHPGSKTRGVAKLLLPLLIENGGRQLDAFDTVLPRLSGVMHLNPPRAFSK